MDRHSRLLNFCERAYAWLLRAYPLDYRREFGGPMADAFRDLCRNTLRQRGAWGLLWVCLSVLADTAVTSMREQRGQIMSAPKKIFTAKLSSDSADRKFGLVVGGLASQLIMPLAVHKMTLLGCTADEMVTGIVCAGLVGTLIALCAVSHVPQDKSLMWFRRLLLTRITSRPANPKFRQLVFFAVSLIALVLGVFTVDALKLSEAQVLFGVLIALAAALFLLLCGLLLTPTPPKDTTPKAPSLAHS